MWPKKLQNFQEVLVSERLEQFAAQYSVTNESQIEDIACIALNSLTPRYVRHLADLQRYMTDDQRRAYETQAEAAVRAAFEYVLFEKSPVARKARIKG